MAAIVIALAMMGAMWATIDFWPALSIVALATVVTWEAARFADWFQGPHPEDDD